MTAMPGSPEIQNVIPMAYFNTDTFAAPLLGLVASFIMLSLGLLWLNLRYKKAKKIGEGYGIVIKSLPVFLLLQDSILNISSNPIIAEALSVNLICGVTASASGGLDTLPHNGAVITTLAIF